MYDAFIFTEICSYGIVSKSIGAYKIANVMREKGGGNMVGPFQGMGLQNYNIYGKYTNMKQIRGVKRLDFYGHTSIDNSKFQKEIISLRKRYINDYSKLILV